MYTTDNDKIKSGPGKMDGSSRYDEQSKRDGTLGSQNNTDRIKLLPILTHHFPLSCFKY